MTLATIFISSSNIHTHTHRSQTNWKNSNSTWSKKKNKCTTNITNKQQQKQDILNTHIICAWFIYINYFDRRVLYPTCFFFICYKLTTCAYTHRDSLKKQEWEREREREKTRSNYFYLLSKWSRSSGIFFVLYVTHLNLHMRIR